MQLANKRALTGVCKSLICSTFNRHEQGDVPNIWLAGSRRSGTTMLMQVLASTRGVKYTDQPFSLHSADTPVLIRKIPIYDGGLIISPDETELSTLESYIAEIVNGDLHMNENWRFWRKDFDRVSNRIVFKVTDAQYISEWASARFGFEVLHLTRHPIAQSLSVIRNGWGNLAKHFLRNVTFCERYLDGGIDAKCHDILSHGKELDQYVLGWALENQEMLKTLGSHRDWHSISYEAFVADRTLEISRLTDLLGLGSIDVMEQGASRPSKSSKLSSEQSTKEEIRKGNHEALLKRWQSEVLPSDARQAMEVLDWFDIDLYRWDDWKAQP